MEVLLRLDDEAADALALGAYSIEDPLLNPDTRPLDDRDPLLHARRLVDLARGIFGLGAVHATCPDGHGLHAVARLFDAIELALEIAATAREDGGR